MSKETYRKVVVGEVRYSLHNLSGLCIRPSVHEVRVVGRLSHNRHMWGMEVDHKVLEEKNVQILIKIFFSLPVKKNPNKCTLKEIRRFQ